jgi:hypothetical protein
VVLDRGGSRSTGHWRREYKLFFDGSDIINNIRPDQYRIAATKCPKEYYLSELLNSVILELVVLECLTLSRVYYIVDIYFSNIAISDYCIVEFSDIWSHSFSDLLIASLTWIVFDHLSLMSTLSFLKQNEQQSPPSIRHAVRLFFLIINCFIPIWMKSCFGCNCSQFWLSLSILCEIHSDILCINYCWRFISTLCKCRSKYELDDIDWAINCFAICMCSRDKINIKFQVDYRSTVGYWFSNLSRCQRYFNEDLWCS